MTSRYSMTSYSLCHNI